LQIERSRDLVLDHRGGFKVQNPRLQILNTKIIDLRNEKEMQEWVIVILQIKMALQVDCFGESLINFSFDCLLSRQRNSLGDVTLEFFDGVAV